MLRNSGTADSAVAGLDLESCPTGHEGLGIDPSVLLANSRCASGATGDQGGVTSIGTNRRERECVCVHRRAKSGEASGSWNRLNQTKFQHLACYCD